MNIMEKPIEIPTKPCYNCGGDDWWQRVPGGYYICSVCHPNPNKIPDKEAVNEHLDK